MFLPPSFLRTAAGRKLVAERLPAARAHLAKKGVSDNGAQGFAFYGSFAALAFATNLAARPPFTIEPPRTLPVACLRARDWQVCLSWQVVPEHPSRFVLDAQNFLELWHREAGYLAGTGNSKFMPRFSTVRRTNAGRAYVPVRTRCLRASAEAAEVGYAFGDDEIVISVRLADGRCEVAARVAKGEGDADYEFGLPLAFHPGETLASEHGVDQLDPTVLIHHHGGPRPQRGFKWRGLEWTLPEGAVLDYPLVPHNSYTQDGLPAREDYVGRLSFPLTGEAKVIRIG